MHRIDAQKARPPLRVRLAPFPDGYRGRPRGLVHGGMLAVQRPVAQIVQVRYRDLRQPRVFRLAEPLVLPPQNAAGRRPAQSLVGAVHICQQAYIAVGVLADELVAPVPSQLDGSGREVHLDQPRGLRHAQSGHFAQVGADGAALLLALPCVLLRDQQLLRKRVPFGAALPGKFDGVAQFQKLADLIGIQCLGGLHVYVHSVAARPSFHLHFQYHLALESSRVSVSSCVGQF